MPSGFTTAWFRVKARCPLAREQAEHKQAETLLLICKEPSTPWKFAPSVNTTGAENKESDEEKVIAPHSRFAHRRKHAQVSPGSFPLEAAIHGMC